MTQTAHVIRRKAMETKFYSQICTSREQSERLLALGLKMETADMYYQKLNDKWTPFVGQPFSYDGLRGTYLIPAWSLDRLMSLMPRTVKVDGRLYGCMMELGGCVQYINLLVDKIIWAAHYSVSNSFDGLISCIEWLIKEGYFNKEYLEE